MKDNIRAAVEKGWTAICPQRNITLNNWNGQGWLIVDPSSGAAGYLLAGRLISGNTVEVINGGSATEATEETITGSSFWDFMLHSHDWLTYMHLFGKAALYAGVVGYFFPQLWSLGAVMLIFGGLALFFASFLLLHVALWLWYEQQYVKAAMIRLRRRYPYRIAFA